MKIEYEKHIKVCLAYLTPDPLLMIFVLLRCMTFTWSSKFQLRQFFKGATIYSIAATSVKWEYKTPFKKQLCDISAILVSDAYMTLSTYTEWIRNIIDCCQTPFRLTVTSVKRAQVYKYQCNPTLDVFNSWNKELIN